MSDTQQAHPYPGGGHRQLADAVAAALAWADSLPPGTVVQACGFGGGPTTTIVHHVSTTPDASYWWSAAARTEHAGGLSAGKNVTDPDEARRYSVRTIISSAVIFAQQEAATLAQSAGTRGYPKPAFADAVDGKQ